MATDPAGRQPSHAPAPPPTYYLDRALHDLKKVIDAGLRGPVLRVALEEALRVANEEPRRIAQHMGRAG